MENIVLDWVLPISVMAGSFCLFLYFFKLLYHKIDNDVLWQLCVKIGIGIGVTVAVWVFLKNMGLVDEVKNIGHMIHDKIAIYMPQIIAFFDGIHAKAVDFLNIIKNFLARWWPVYYRAFCIIYPFSICVAIWSLYKRISFYRGFNIIVSYMILHPLLTFKYFTGHATPAFDYIISRLFVAQLKENLNDSYAQALKGGNFKDGAGGTSATQTKKAVALAMRYTRSKVETIGGNRNNRHAKLVIKRSREIETDNLISSTLKGFGERISEPFIQFQREASYNSMDDGYVFDSDVNYRSGEYLGEFKSIFENPFKTENKKVNGGKGTIQTFFKVYKGVIEYFFHITPYSIYDRTKIVSAIKFARDTTIEKAKYIARQNINLSILPEPRDSRTGNTIDIQRKLALECANERINDITSALLANKIRGTFDNVVVGGSTAIYHYNLPKDPELPNDFSDIEKRMANILKTSIEPVLQLSAGILSVTISNAKADGVPINIPVDFAEMIRNRDKGMSSLVSGIVGVDALGNNIYVTLGDALPHIFFFGKTGSGKTVTLMSFIFSVMDAVTPDDVLFITIDGKGNSFETFHRNHNPFMLCRPADGSGDIEYTRALVRFIAMEVRRRIQVFKEAGVSKLAEYNERFPDKKMQVITVIFDEFSAVMSKDDELKGDDYNKYCVSNHMVYIFKMSRSTGIYVVGANQTARKTEIKGEMSANVPGRLSLGVSEPIESEIALPDTGIAVHKISQPGEFYSIANGSNNVEHGNTPYLPDSQIDALSQDLARVFPNRHYLYTVEEIKELAERSMNEIDGGEENGVTYEIPSSLPTPVTPFEELVATCRKYPEWALNNAKSDVILGNNAFNKGTPSSISKAKMAIEGVFAELRKKQAEDLEKEMANNAKTHNSTGSTVSVLRGAEGDFGSYVNDVAVGDVDDTSNMNPSEEDKFNIVADKIKS